MNPPQGCRFGDGSGGVVLYFFAEGKCRFDL